MNEGSSLQPWRRIGRWSRRIFATDLTNFLMDDGHTDRPFTRQIGLRGLASCVTCRQSASVTASSTFSFSNLTWRGSLSLHPVLAYFLRLDFSAWASPSSSIYSDFLLCPFFKNSLQSTIDFAGFVLCLSSRALLQLVALDGVENWIGESEKLEFAMICMYSEPLDARRWNLSLLNGSSRSCSRISRQSIFLICSSKDSDRHSSRQIRLAEVGPGIALTKVRQDRFIIYWCRFNFRHTLKFT